MGRRLVGVAILALAALGVTPVLAEGATAHAPVVVPQLVGRTPAQVNAVLRADGLYYTTVGASGAWVRVRAQAPVAGTRVAWHSSVRLTVLAAPSGRVAPVAPVATVAVPNLVGASKAQVYAVLRRVGLYFRAVGAGAQNGAWLSVEAQSPAPGARVAKLATITLRVAIVNPRVNRPMPNLTGLNRAQVNTIMKAFQLYYTLSGPGASNNTWTYVVSQTPYAATTVKWHAMVHLVVTNRPKPVTTTTLKRAVATTTTSTTTTIAGATTTTQVGDTTTTSTSTTTTTIRPVTPTTVRKPLRYRIGDATWYSYIPGFCATSYLPMGTHITVTNLATGKSIHCLVTDREAAKGNRVVDLSETQFSQLQPLWRGVFRAKVSW